MQFRRFLVFSPHNSIIEAASAGASASIKIVANIAVNLIAFIAMLRFVNATLTWFGHRVGLVAPELTFQVGEICPCFSKLFIGFHE